MNIQKECLGLTLNCLVGVFSVLHLLKPGPGEHVQVQQTQSAKFNDLCFHTAEDRTNIPS